MNQDARKPKFDSEARDVLVLESFKKFILSLDYKNSKFILSLGAAKGYPTVESLQRYLEDSLKSFARNPDIKRIFYQIISNVKGNVKMSADEIETYLTEIILENDYSYWNQYVKESRSPEKTKAAVLRLIDIVLAKKLRQIVSHRIDNKDYSNPQVLINILNYFSEGRPIYILIVDSLIKIILEETYFDIEERGIACRIVVNNYRIENTLIYILTNKELDNRQKYLICTAIRAYQKVYWKMLLLDYDPGQEKETVAKTWFGVKDFESVRYYQAPKITNDYIDSIIAGDHVASTMYARYLVLSMDFEDLLRLLYVAIHDRGGFDHDEELIFALYKQLYTVMNDYRDICQMERQSARSLKSKLSDRSKETRLSEQPIISAVKRHADMTPMLETRTPHPLLPETVKNLEESGLLHLFKIWPIPEISQNLFNIVCKLKDRIPEGKEFAISHLLHREKLLAFLMRLDRAGIKIIKTDLPLITNAVQLETHNYFRQGQYFGSTGFWQFLAEKPPSVWYCARPHAVGNCLDQPLRHVILRIFLGSGELYRSPFIVDSTPRFGSIDEGIDEDGIVNSLLIRPGMFLLDIPQKIKTLWAMTQSAQMKTLQEVISKKISDANRAR
ncbi:hypothetical protein PITCH_A190067 [uncultured Desulfobacterium sp.]|uniref:Uncharacterized protein n=1 Tax=uncultured Desulfobacterium sp. TaxID=201089 RepID=A0A445MVW0_9BACT|nr:hypothetical protein PITCH_A190067 [uncultured Desulfobacterium sp.]